MAEEPTRTKPIKRNDMSDMVHRIKDQVRRDRAAFNSKEPRNGA